MGISPREARDLTLWEYEALLVQWNYAHETDPQPEPATVEQIIDTEQFFADHPELLN